LAIAKKGDLGEKGKILLLIMIFFFLYFLLACRFFSFGILFVLGGWIGMGWGGGRV
jgi:hypothetical protein